MDGNATPWITAFNDNPAITVKTAVNHEGTLMDTNPDGGRTIMAFIHRVLVGTRSTASLTSLPAGREMSGTE